MDKNDDLPLVTFALFSYNQEKYIREAVVAALNQEYVKLEIILSDDCSTDSTIEVINSIVLGYSGPHKVVVNKNPVNMGLAKHFSTIVARARGEIIVVAAGDDISLPNRVSNTVEMLCNDPEASFASFTDTVINEDGSTRRNWTSWGGKGNTIQKASLEDYICGCAPPLPGASRGFRKRVFDIFGDLNTACPTEDTPYILRGLMVGHALVSSKCGILYRKHNSNLSGPSSLYSMKIAEIRNQYLCDVKTALSAGFITQELGSKINNWIDKDYRRRKLTSNFFNNPNKAKFFFQEMLPRKEFKFREKLKMLRMVLKRW